MKYLSDFKLYENLNLARSILRKKGVLQEDPDFAKIREIAKDKMGYLGLLTKLHYVDNVPLDELSDILNLLSETSTDVSKVINLGYNELSDLLYDKRVSSKDNGYKFQFTDGVYDYFRVFTYDGILNIGSPAWCIKTKSNFDNYTSNDPTKNQQWVMVKKIGKKLLTPNTNYINKYQNTSNPLIRIGITFNNSVKKLYAFDDNDGRVDTIGGKGKEIVENIKKFWSQGKFDAPTIESILKREPIIVYDKTKKVLQVNTLEELADLNEHFNLDVKWKEDDIRENYFFVLVDDQKFIKFINFTQNLWVSELDSSDRTYNENLNSKLYFEISKWIKVNSKYIPIVLMPHALKLGSTTIEKIIEVNKGKDVDIFKYNNKDIFVNYYLNKEGRIALFFMDLGLLGNSMRSSMILMLYDKSPSSHWDLNKLYDMGLESRNLTDSNFTIIEEVFGEENIKKYYSIMLDKLNRFKKEKSFSTKVKKWFS